LRGEKRKKKKNAFDAHQQLNHERRRFNVNTTRLLLTWVSGGKKSNPLEEPSPPELGLSWAIITKPNSALSLAIVTTSCAYVAHAVSSRVAAVVKRGRGRLGLAWRDVT
jgi:hypothetical protein